MNILVAAAWMSMAAMCNQPLHGQRDCCMPGVDGPCWHTSAPAEHVIEIRTKREVIIVPSEVLVPDHIWKCPKNMLDFAPNHQCKVPRITREIWIDGKKWGVLKESGQ